MRYLAEKNKSTVPQRNLVYALSNEAGEDVNKICFLFSKDGEATVIAELSKKEASNVIDFFLETKSKQIEGSANLKLA